MDTLSKYLKHSFGVGDILARYVDIATRAVTEGYAWESVGFETGNKRINGSAYFTIEGIAKETEQ